MSTTRQPGEDRDDELSSWAEDFKSEQPRRDEPPLSAEAVLREAERGARWQRLAWVSQTGGLAFAMLVFLGLVVRTGSMLLAALSAVVLPTLVALFGLFVHLRQSVGKNEDESVASFVALTTRRREAEVRLLRANRVGLAFLAAVFWLWLPLFVQSRAERFAAQPWRLVVSVSCSLVIFGGSWWYVGRRVRRAEDELARWKQLSSSLQPRTGGPPQG